MSSASAYDTDLTFDAALAIRSHRPADLACCLASHASHAASSLNRRTGSSAGLELAMVKKLSKPRPHVGAHAHPHRFRLPLGIPDRAGTGAGDPEVATRASTA